MIRNRGVVAAMVVAVVIVLDQLLKVWVKTHMALHESIRLAGTWAQLFFTENKGMAFGMEFMGTYLLCGLRIVAVVVLVQFIRQTVARGAGIGVVVCLSLVLAGAAGNIFDNLFYGMIFTESTPYREAQLVAFGEGYGSLFSGKVVDMFYFPIVDVVLPSWLPLKGGDRFIFFAPVFNLADAAITCGGFVLVLFYHKAFSQLFSQNNVDAPTDGTA